MTTEGTIQDLPAQADDLKINAAVLATKIAFQDHPVQADDAKICSEVKDKVQQMLKLSSSQVATYFCDKVKSRDYGPNAKEYLFAIERDGKNYIHVQVMTCPAGWFTSFPIEAKDKKAKNDVLDVLVD